MTSIKVVNHLQKPAEYIIVAFCDTQLWVETNCNLYLNRLEVKTSESKTLLFNQVPNCLPYQSACRSLVLIHSAASSGCEQDMDIIVTHFLSRCLNVECALSDVPPSLCH